MRRADAFEKALMLGGFGGRRRRGQQRVRWFDGLTDSMDMGLSGLRELGTDREAWRPAVQFRSLPFPSVQFSRSVLSDSSRPNELQRARPVHHQLPEFAQTHVHRVGDAVQPSHALSSPSPPY